jgi:hypothetical protein
VAAREALAGEAAVVEEAAEPAEAFSSSRV